jgi:hypothetical protein
MVQASLVVTMAPVVPLMMTISPVAIHPVAIVHVTMNINVAMTMV